jgi:hypothetical protein
MYLINIFRGIFTVLFKKCCFCGEKFKWEDKVATNINDKRIAHYDCLEKDFKHKSSVSADDDFYGMNFMG